MVKEINSQMEEKKQIAREMNKKKPHSETEGNQKEETILKEGRGKLLITFKRPGQNDTFSTTKLEPRTQWSNIFQVQKVIKNKRRKEGRKEGMCLEHSTVFRKQRYFQEWRGSLKKQRSQFERNPTDQILIV